MRNRVARCLFLMLVLALATGASATSQASSQGSAKPGTAQTKHYKLAGTVKSVDAKGHSLTVQAGDIPGFMPAMTMPYDVAKNESLDKIVSGDQITADVVVTGDESHLEHVTVTGHAKPKDK
jgi:protein SCO1/2